MKLTKVLRILGVMLILSTLAAVIPAVPAFAAINEISISPTSGKIGDTVTVIGENWDAYTPGANEYWAEIYFAKDSVNLLKLIGSDDVNTYKFVGESDDSIDSDGYFEATFTVPSRLSDGTDDEDVTTGDYYVYVTIYKDTTGDNYIIHCISLATVSQTKSIM